jgi:hypothetical protein
MEGHIFINYRRDDSSASAGRLYDRLSSHFSANQVFFDIDNLPLGVDFADVIEENVGSCDVLIAVIGRRWISSHEGGKRRLDNPDDFVRIEIATALKRNIRVIPVLVDGATMPPARELPDDLKPLVRRNALELSHKRFSADLERLIGALERALEKTTAERRVIEHSTVQPRESEEKLRLETKRSPEVGKLLIPPQLLGSAEPATVLRLTRDAESTGQVLACVRNRFLIGRSPEAGADLVTQFFPSNEENDVKTKQLSRIHVACKCENGEIFLFDGNGINPSGNGSRFDAHILSTATPFVLRDPGDLRLADVYSIRVIPRISDRSDAPDIANLDSWKGPITESEPLAAGAILFVPDRPSEIGIAVWLFSVAPFGTSDASPLNFALSAGEPEIGALRYSRGCFWIEQRIAHPVSVDGLALAPLQIAPLVTGQMLEVSGSKSGSS